MVRYLAAIALLLVLSPSVATAESASLDAPSGRFGAGIGMKPLGIGRAWGEVSFFKGSGGTVIAPTAGAGFLVLPKLELEAMIPVSHVSGTFDSYTVGSHTALGNVYAGANYINLDGPVRYKAGLGIALPTAPDSRTGGEASILAANPDANQQYYLRWPNALGIIVPARVEGGNEILMSLDVEIATLIATDRGGSFGLQDDVELYTVLAPGVGGRPAEPVLLGLRIPVFVAWTGQGDDLEQVSVEPFARVQVGTGFFSARFTVPIDEPLGFAFDPRKYWGLHVGGGGAF